MKVLYLNHTPRISGGERSLLDVLAALPPEVAPHLACPEGQFADAARRLGVPVTHIPGTDGSLRLHPVHTAAALAAIVEAAAITRRVAAEVGAQIVHANSIRAGIVASVAHQIGAPPAVVYVRDSLPPGAVSALSLRLMSRGAAALLPNSEYTARTLSRRSGPSVRVVHSPLDPRSFDPTGVDREKARQALWLREDEVALAVVAQLTPWKGQDDAIRILARLRERGRKVRLLIVGSAKFLSKATRYDNDAYRAWLGKLAWALGVEDEVMFLGEREDVPAILAATDIALLPSWEEPFGRSLIEAMAMECAVVATNVGGPREIVGDGAGFLLPPRRPRLWADVVDDLVMDPARREALAKAGTRRAEAFSVDRHVEALLDVYTTVRG